MWTPPADATGTRASLRLENSLIRSQLPCGGGTGSGAGTFLRGLLRQTYGHHEVIQRRAFQQLHQSHVVLKCVGFIPRMEDEVFDTEMLLAFI